MIERTATTTEAEPSQRDPSARPNGGPALRGPGRRGAPLLARWATARAVACEDPPPEWVYHREIRPLGATCGLWHGYGPDGEPEESFSHDCEEGSTCLLEEYTGEYTGRDEINAYGLCAPDRRLR